jgi:hypothetical protein
MENPRLIILFFLTAFIYCCNTTEPEFNPDKIFIDVENGTISSDGEFEMFNYSSESIFVHHVQFPFCSFFPYSVEQYTDSGWIKLNFDETSGEWKRVSSYPDSAVICELYKPLIEILSISSFKQKITGLKQVGDYRLTINYSLKDENNFRFYSLLADYKITH